MASSSVEIRKTERERGAFSTMRAHRVFIFSVKSLLRDQLLESRGIKIRHREKGRKKGSEIGVKFASFFRRYAQI